MNKLEIKKKIKDLESEISQLKEILEAPINLFTCIGNYSDVCEQLNIKELSLEDFTSKRAFAFHKIENIQKLFNGDWIVDFKNRNQRKYYPYFEYQNSRLVFHFSSSYLCIFVGLVAFYKDQQTSDFVGQVFKDIYEDLI